MYVCICIHTHMCVYIYIYTHICITTKDQRGGAQPAGDDLERQPEPAAHLAAEAPAVSMYRCTHVCMYVYIYIYTRI